MPLSAPALRYPATLATGSTALLLTGFFAATGALSPSALPWYASPGMIAMLIVLPETVEETTEGMEETVEESIETAVPEAGPDGELP